MDGAQSFVSKANVLFCLWDRLFLLKGLLF